MLDFLISRLLFPNQVSIWLGLKEQISPSSIFSSLVGYGCFLCWCIHWVKYFLFSSFIFLNFTVSPPEQMDLFTPPAALVPTPRRAPSLVIGVPASSVKSLRNISSCCTALMTVFIESRGVDGKVGRIEWSRSVTREPLSSNCANFELYVSSFTSGVEECYW